MLNQPLQIGSLTIRNRVVLAPLAGVSDPPFRRICQELGAGLTYVEMLSAPAVIHAGERTYAMISRHASESVLGVQITGRRAAEVAKAVEFLDKQGFDTIDINMGCPVRKIVHSGSGSGFLREPERITATVEAVRAVTKKPISAKTRLGFERPTRTVEDSATRIAAAGADAFTVHGRYRDDGYCVRVDHEGIATGIRAARQARPGIVVMGNGDVMDRASAELMVKNTGCDAVMVSRGALGNPWIFDEILGKRPSAPTLGEWVDVVLRHIAYHEEFYGEGVLSARRIRKHLIWYASGFPRCSKVRTEFNIVESMAAARQLIKDYASQYPSSFVRYENTRELAVATDPKYDMDRSLDRGVGDEGF